MSYEKISFFWKHNFFYEYVTIDLMPYNLKFVVACFPCKKAHLINN